MKTDFLPFLSPNLYNLSIPVFSFVYPPGPKRLVRHHLYFQLFSQNTPPRFLAPWLPTGLPVGGAVGITVGDEGEFKALIPPTHSFLLPCYSSACIPLPTEVAHVFWLLSKAPALLGSGNNSLLLFLQPRGGDNFLLFLVPGSSVMYCCHLPAPL